MATWNDVKLWTTSQNTAFTDHGEFIETKAVFPTNRSQVLFIIHNRIDEWTDGVTVQSPIALYNPLKTESLLLAAYMGAGGVAIQDMNDGTRYYVLQTAFPLAGLDASLFARLVMNIAARADWLEGKIFKLDIA